MASVISLIKAQLLTEIATTSINRAYEGPVTKTPSTYPWAEVIFSGGEVGEYVTQEIDRNYRMTIMVHGITTEQVEIALEELAVKWNTAAELAAILALGVVVINPVAHYPPFTETNSTQMPIIGDISFAFRVQY